MLRAPLLLIRIIDSHNQDHDEDEDEEQCLNAFWEEALSKCNQHTVPKVNKINPIMIKMMMLIWYDHDDNHDDDDHDNNDRADHDYSSIQIDSLYLVSQVLRESKQLKNRNFKLN